MEKQTAAYKNFRVGLLIFILTSVFGFSKGFAKPTWEYIQTLRWQPVNDYQFTKQDEAFVLEINDVTPDNVALYVQYLNESVSFTSSRKESTMDFSDPLNPIKGTKVIAWFNFSKPGNLHMRPILVQINGGLYSIPFNDMTIYENLNDVKPYLFVEFENAKYNPKAKSITVTAGDHISWTVYIRYAMQISSWTWNIPENSIFSELERYDISNFVPKGAQFSPKAYPIATFDWQPLVEGTYNLPEIYVTATAYNGSRKNLEPPSVKFKVEKNKDVQVDDKTETVFAYAFAKPLENDEAEVIVELDGSQCQEYAKLRSRERKGFPWSKFVSDRKDFEQIHGLSAGPGEAKYPVMFLWIGLFVLCLAGAILFMVFRKKVYGALAWVFCVVFLSLSCVQGIRCGKKYAICVGCELNSIPEHGVESGVYVNGGSRIEVVNSAGEWRFVRYNNFTGWVYSDKVFEIR